MNRDCCANPRWVAGYIRDWRQADSRHRERFARVASEQLANHNSNPNASIWGNSPEDYRASIWMLAEAAVLS